MPNAPLRAARVTSLSGASGPGDVLRQLEQVLLGKREQVTLALACLLARGHLLIEDVPGVGKTTLAQALGATLGLPWTRVQFTSDLLPADIVGVSVFDVAAGTFEFRPGPVFTSVLLADEINRAPPKAQSALLEAMEERQVSVDGVTHALDPDFFVIATQNPADQLGAYPLPESQLDRFLVGLEIGYPDAATERQLLEQGDRRAGIGALEPRATAADLARWTGEAAALHCAAPVFDYVQALLSATRRSDAGPSGGGPSGRDQGRDQGSDQGGGLCGGQGGGLSPRAGIALVRLSRAFARLAERDHVLPEDVRDVFPALAGHRLTGRVGAGRTAAREVLDRVPMP